MVLVRSALGAVAGFVLAAMLIYVCLPHRPGLVDERFEKGLAAREYCEVLFVGPSYVCLLGAVLYSIQIYCDFSGYTDMAVACAAALGYELAKNFDAPYFSRNLREFWRSSRTGPGCDRVGRCGSFGGRVRVLPT